MLLIDRDAPARRAGFNAGHIATELLGTAAVPGTVVGFWRLLTASKGHCIRYGGFGILGHTLRLRRISL